MASNNIVVGLTRPITDDYKLGRNLGEKGQFGYAQLAVHKKTGKQYAVKVINKARFSAAYYEQFRREIAFLKSLDHKYVVKGFGCYEDKINLYLPMELCLGGELFDRIKAKERYSEKDAQNVCKQMLEAIQYLHSNNIAHCDLKPDNFLFASPDEDSDIKIIDFGLSRLTKRREYHHVVTGTSFYIAPEVLKKKYTFHCDIWSFGVIMFIMLFGFPPFHGTDSEIHKKIKRGFSNKVKDGYGPWFPRSIPVSECAKDLISKCLELDPAVRLTATEALEHDFFSVDQSSDPIEGVIKNLNAFTATCNFKTAVLSAMTESLSDTELNALMKTFKAIDINGDGNVSIDELKKAIAEGKATSEETQRLIELADVDGDGELSYNELVMVAVQKKLMAKEERLFNTFSALDIDGNGTITADEIEAVLGSQPDIHKMISEVDTDGDGCIDYDEFVRMFISMEESNSQKVLEIDFDHLRATSDNEDDDVKMA